jgi:hypothetical protein
MLKYCFCYNYIKLNCNDIVIQLSKDNTCGKLIFSAKTNVLFKDEYGDWGHACGVGNSEEKALEMCLNEIANYIKTDVEQPLSIETLIIPKKFTFIYKDKAIILFIQNCNDNQVILTNNSKIYIDNDVNVIEFINKNKRKFLDKGVTDTSNEFFAKNKFGIIFDNMSKKFQQ